MVKYFCDNCKKEIEDLSEHGEFRLKEKHFSFLKHQKQEGIRERLWLLCIECARKAVWSKEELKILSQS